MKLASIISSQICSSGPCSRGNKNGEFVECGLYRLVASGRIETSTMSSRVKPIHLAPNLETLESLYTLPKNIDMRKVLVLCQSANRLKQSADRHYVERDEENAFVMYMKYLNLLSTIKSHREYADKKRNIIEALGPNKELILIYEKVEKLKTSLSKRYATSCAQNEREQNKIRNLHDHISPIISHVKDSIDAKELFEMITNSKLSMLIMDCRSEKDFEDSRIRYTFMVNVPESLLVPGMTAGKIHNDLPAESKIWWMYRQVKEQIVLMDNSTRGTPHKDTPLWVLEDILKKWDHDVVYKKPFLRVNGGFQDFLLHYPQYCTNPNHTIPVTDQDDEYRLDDVEYPNISDIRMKDDSFESQPGRPTVDRNSKAAALHTYKTSQSKPINEILHEQEKLIDKSIQNEQELMTTVDELTEIKDREKRVADDQEKEELNRTAIELKYKLMELQNKHMDIESENNDLKEQLHQYKEKERWKEEEGERISAQEAARLAELAQQRLIIKQKQEKMALLERERNEKERQAKLKEAYEKKMQMKENLVERKQTIPQFDRAAKPTGVLSDYNHNVQREVQRDFAPVYGSVGRGLTGLKNLGNTCYMNSILQCLSNTTFLNEYFLEEQFKQNLNRNNKTQGRIAEEVAAVIKALWTGQYKCIASKNLRFVVGQYERQFGGIEQQDSHELLTILMDWLHSDLQTVPIEIDTSLENLPASERAWVEYFKGKESYVAQLSYGQIKSMVKCVRCGKESATYESFSSLSLDLPSDANRCDLSDCLDMYFNGERIMGWNCPQCKSSQVAIKKLDISRLPSILVIHFKRFYADPDALSTVYKKKQNYVKFPLTDLDMSPHVAPSEKTRNHKLKSRRYHLYGVSNHYGSMESGHYTAFCRNKLHNKWYKYDDHTVSSLDKSDVCSSAAYILFYSVLPERNPSDM